MHQLLEPGVEIVPVPQDTGGEFVGETAVALLQSSQGVIQGLIKGLSFVDGPKDAKRRRTGGKAGRSPPLVPAHLSIPSVGLEGTATSRRGMRPAR
jgi:hypothetical protein